MPLASRSMALMRDIVVIGGSAGSLDPLRKIVSAQPTSTKLSIFVVTHLMAASRA